MNQIYAVLKIKPEYLNDIQMFLDNRDLASFCRVAESLEDLTQRHAMNEFLEAPGFSRLLFNDGKPIEFELSDSKMSIQQDPELHDGVLRFASHWNYSEHSMAGFEYFLSSLTGWTDAYRVVASFSDSYLLPDAYGEVEDSTYDIIKSILG